MRRSAMRILLGAAVGLSLFPAAGWSRSKNSQTGKSPLDEYLESVIGPQSQAREARKPGSLWTPGATLNGLGRDLRAYRVHDLVTIAVFESASAVSTGATKTQRTSSAKANVNSILGRMPRSLNPILDVGANSTLDGGGTTSRHNELSTTVSARVTHVLPNGNLVVEGLRSIGINSEQQTITLRGIVRPDDLTTDNIVTSDHLAMLDVRVNGRGVVGDAIRRPNFLYRLLLGLLPF